MLCYLNQFQLQAEPKIIQMLFQQQQDTKMQQQSSKEQQYLQQNLWLKTQTKSKIRCAMMLMLRFVCRQQEKCMRWAWMRIEKKKYEGIRMKVLLSRVFGLGDRVSKMKGFLRIRDKGKIILQHNGAKKQQLQKLNQLIIPKTDQEIEQFCSLLRTNLPKTPTKQCQRQLLFCQLQTHTLAQQTKSLKLQIETLQKRQIRQNSKKRQSLQMLAQELEQKNQLIGDLKKSLALYYEKQGEMENNVLESDLEGLRKEVEDGERVRRKLETDLEAVKQRLEECEGMLGNANRKMRELEGNIVKLKNNRLSSQIYHSKIQKQCNMLESLIKQLQKSKKQLNNHYFQSKLQKIQPIRQIQAQVKLKLLFGYLENMVQMENQIIVDGIFSSEERNIIARLQDLQIQRQKIEEQFHEHQVSNIMGKGLHQDHHHSIFSVLDDEASPLPKRSAQQSMPQPLLSIQLSFQDEKNRLKQQISELKSRFLHIRDVVLNLLRSLDVEIGRKSQAHPVLELIFEIFQYSEEERASIGAKKKKFFGFI